MTGLGLLGAWRGQGLTGFQLLHVPGTLVLDLSAQAHPEAGEGIPLTPHSLAPGWHPGWHRKRLLSGTLAGPYTLRLGMGCLPVQTQPCFRGGGSGI